ncbi:efflux RND transporter permease subunit [Rubrivivax gelatinosus]|uniref:efflux RND transporter permease subunit n=1 Tax=Rubrivivax gelatinosus TaxID=28068 RepID=UPI0002D40996|nr:efflux RND transporter permease subunit [Rubrivivax gelatinosus]MBG6082663.1 multidrug efflux pump subunit AcrB [Rubrivivax gelatinosus]
MQTQNHDAAPAPARERFNISRWALEHAPLTRYLMVVLMVLGIAAYFQLGQDEDPPFTFRAMVVQAYWPGASAQQVAEQVTDKIERTLQEVPYADRIRSYTKPGESVTTLFLAEHSPPAEVRDAWYQVRKRIGDMRSTLPEGVIGPVFNDDFGDVYGSIFALSADGFSQEELREFADDVRQRLLRVPDVSKVEIFGRQAENIFVEVSRKRMAELGLDAGAVVAQLGAQNAMEGAGTLQAGAEQIQLRVGGQFSSVEELRRFPIRAQDPQTGRASTIRLQDIAEIRRAYVDPPDTMVRHQGRQVLALGVSMASGGDIVTLGKALRAAVDELRAELPIGIELDQIQDQPQVVSASVNEFVGVLLEAVVIVLGVSFLSLGLHTRPLRVDIWPGLVVAITIPLVLAITFVVMRFWGIGLHKVSLGALIIALGLLVDDAIIAVEMMVRKLEEGYDKLRAATFAYEITAMPMLTGTLITAAGFLPIGLAKSETGEYTFAIFAVTTAALLVSWLASVYFVPYLGTWLLRTHSKVAAADDGPHELFDSPFYNRFRAAVDWCVAHRWITIGVTVASFALGIFGMTRVQQQFFPESARPELLVDLWLPEGATIRASDDVARRVEKRLLADERVATVSTWVGSGVPRFYLPLEQIFPNSNVSQMILVPKDPEERDSLRRELPAVLAAEFPEVRARVTALPNGPPVAYPVQFRVLGRDAAEVRHWADQAKELMRANPHTRGVNDDWNEAIKVLRLEIDQDKARALGVTSRLVAQTSQTLLSGSTVAQYREGDKLVDVVLRLPEAERDTIADLSSAYVQTASGRAVPLTQVAHLRLDWEPGVLHRQGRDYAATVQADLAEGVQGATVTAQLEPAMRALQARMPPGYRIETAGAVAESSKGQRSIVAGVPAMLFIIFTLLMLQLRSFGRALLVFLTGPLGIAGAAAAMLLLDQPFGFVALLGVIALAGMIMRNSVILIDQIELDRARGVAAWDAIIEAAVRRFRPIVLTAAAAVLAMIPLSRSTFWGPMAVAIMGGLVLATALTLLALPAMYAAWFRVRREGGAGR